MYILRASGGPKCPLYYSIIIFLKDLKKYIYIYIYKCNFYF